MKHLSNLTKISRSLSSTFQNTPQLCCGDEPSHYKIVRGEWLKKIFLRGLIPRRKVLDLFLFFLVIFSVSFTIGPLQDVCRAQEFPTKEIKILLPLAPGGGMDIVTRLFAGNVEKILGAPVVVVNNSAGGGVAASLSVAQAKPDGYTLLGGPTGHIVLKPVHTPNLPYRHTDFTPVSRIIIMPVVIFVNHDAPWKSLKDLVDYAKKNPGKLRAITGTGGGFLQVLTDLFKTEAGIDFPDIPTKGGAELSTALLGGHADLCTDTIANNASFLRAGRMRALVSTHKVPGFPMIKTFEEEGYPGVSLKLWHAIFAPKGLPKPILTKLTKAFEKACNDPSLQEQLEKLYVLPDYRSPEEMSKLIESEREITYKIFKQSGIVK